MSSDRFPIYRQLANGRSMFRIESEARFTEIQRIGARYVVFTVVAATWPERLRIVDMLAAADGSVAPADAEDFNRWHDLAHRPG